MLLKNILKSTIYILLFSVFISCQEKSGDTFKFAFLTDIHVTPGSNNEVYFDSVVTEINLSDVELVIITGDISNTGSDAELLSVKAILDKLIKPYLIIPGNHETNWSESAGQSFTELWGNDRFITQWNNFILVGFNTGPYMKMGDGHIKQEDLQWLKKELAAKVVDQKMLLSFAHYPLADGLDNWAEVTGILKEYKCLAALCGHGHRLGLHNFDGIPGIMGRSLILREPKSPGYNIVEIKSDSIFVFEKVPGEPLGNAAIKFSLNNPVEIAELPISLKPNYAVNELYPQVKNSFQSTDTTSIFSGISLVGDTMFIYGNSMGWLKAINHKKNQTQWETKFQGSVFSTPAKNNKVVVIGAIDGIIYGLNIKTGKTIWQVNTGNPVLASPLIIDNYVYIGGGKAAFYCINVTTGEIKWVFDAIDGLIQGKPVASDDNVVFGAWDRHLYCVSAATGKLKWKWNNGKSNVLFSPGNIVPVISNNKVFIVAPDRYMTAIDLNSGQQLWRTNKHQVRESMGLSPDGQEVYAKLMNDSIVSVSATGKTFNTKWVADAGILYDHNPCPVIANDKWVIGATKNGLVTAIDRKTQTVAWMHKAGNSSINLMALEDDNNIWISLMEGKIIRLTITD